MDIWIGLGAVPLSSGFYAISRCLGNEVQVLFSDGSILHFRVTDIEYYRPQDAPLQQIFGNRNGKYLNLITCAGDWIPSQQQTTQRLVVYTTLI